jgi:hypothetical protein
MDQAARPDHGRRYRRCDLLGTCGEVRLWLADPSRRAAASKQASGLRPTPSRPGPLALGTANSQSLLAVQVFSGESFLSGARSRLHILDADSGQLSWQVSLDHMGRFRAELAFTQIAGLPFLVAAFDNGTMQMWKVLPDGPGAGPRAKPLRSPGCLSFRLLIRHR